MSRLVQPWLAANLSKTLNAATDTANPQAVSQNDQGVNCREIVQGYKLLGVQDALACLC